jgi:tetratricopeptide (TPR) repeat protein
MDTEPRITVDNELFLGRIDEQNRFREVLRNVMAGQDDDAPLDTEPRITVDNELFLGRIDEQNRFREVLRTVMKEQYDDAPTFIFLIHGEGGMGKSKLSRRFRDIATREAPFESGFHVLLIDWELKRGRNLALQVGREAIRVETVFDTIHRDCIDEGWGKHFDDYQEAVERSQQAEQQVSQELERETGGGRYAELRDLGATALAKFVRLSQPEIGKTGEALTRSLLSVGIQAGAEQAARLSQRADEFLRARLDADHYDAFRRPNETLARALAQGLERVSRRRGKPLVMLLDTYEIVDRVDPWLREVIKHAGPRVIWIIAGRHNLVDSRHTDRFVGYSAEFPRRLTDWDVRELAIDYVLDYLEDRAPQRETTRQEAEAIHRATLGVPLAVKTAADLWAQGVPLSGITEGIPDRAPREEIVRLMTERVLIHCDDPADRRALHFLAMQRRPDAETLQAALRPAELGSGERFDLTAMLDHLARCYSSVQLTGGARLHDATGAFIREYLLTTEVRATADVSELARRAAEAVRDRRDRIERYHPLLEERCESEDWTEATLDLAHWLLWRDEYAAWDEIIPRFVEGLGYERDLCRGLIEVLEDFELALGGDGRKRFKMLRAGLGGRGMLTLSRPDAEDEQRMLTRLMRWTKHTKPADDVQNRERRAILYLRQGKLLHRGEQYEDALAALQEAQRYLPDDGEALKRQLGEAFYELSGKIIWPSDASDAVYSSAGEQAIATAIELLPDHQGAHYRLGTVLAKSNRHEEAIAAYQRAIELGPENAYPHNGLGSVYDDLGRHEEAIAAYQRAIELDPEYASPHNGLGNVYADLGRHEEAIAAYERAIELDPEYAYPHNGLGNVYYQQGRHEEAIAAYQRAIELDPEYAYPHNNLGLVYDGLGRHEEAIRAYKQALSVPDSFGTPASAHTLAHNGLGNVYYQQGRHEEAIAAYQRAIELDPEIAVLQASFAAACRELGREADYKQHIARARELMADENEYNKACIESITGNADAALDHLAKALERAPGFRAWARRDLDLAFIRDDPRFQALMKEEE